MGKILQIGEELDSGRLVVVGQLKSSGQYAEIYRVRKTRAPLECLLKVNLPHDMLDKDAIAESAYEYSKEDHIVRTDREIQMLVTFDHPNIAQIDDVVNFKRYKGILFRPISKARTLRQIILDEKNKKKKFEEEKYFIRAKKLKNFIEKLTKAVEYVHDAKGYIVHRDIRPENIVVDKFDQVFLIDFGTACKEYRLDKKWGSLKYAPPEIHAGKPRIYSDFWSLGLCLFEYLTLEHLIDNNPNLKVRRAHIIEKVRSLNQEDLSVSFTKELLEKLYKIKLYVKELNSKYDSSFRFRLNVTSLSSMDMASRVDEGVFDKNLEKMMRYCMPIQFYRRDFLIHHDKWHKHFNYLMDRLSKNQPRAQEAVDRILGKLVM